MISPELWSNGHEFLITTAKLSLYIVLFIAFLSIPYWIYK